MNSKINHFFEKVFNTETRIGRITSQLFIVLNLTFLGLLFIEYIFDDPWIKSAEIFLAVIFTFELIGRFVYQHQKDWKSFGSKVNNILDIIVVLAVLSKFFLPQNIILQTISAFRILRMYRMLDEIAGESSWLYSSSLALKSFINLVLFVTIMGGLVLEFQGPQNEQINSMVDAIYFTMSTLTTTGFGDITPVGESGRALTILIMVIGTALFFRMVTNIFRPPKQYFMCPDCGLYRHDLDASHCKHCGRVVHTVSHGDY